MRHQLPLLPPHERAAFTIAEASSYAGLSRSSLYRLMSSGTLPSARVLGRRLILRDDIDKLLAVSRTTTSTLREI